MKNLVKKSNVVNNVNAFAKFQQVTVQKSQMKQVKGGEDIIIVEEIAGN